MRVFPGHEGRTALSGLLRYAIAVCLAASCLLTAAGRAHATDEKQVIAIGLIPEINIFAQMERFRPLAEYLGRETGTEVKLHILSRYGNIIESFQSYPLDGAFFGSFTGALAIEKLGVVPVARPVKEDGHSTYYGHIFVRKDSGIASVEDMRGKRMAFVERATSAGYVFPLAYLKEHGVKSIDGFFGEYYFTGSHDNAILAVLDGRADIGAAKDTVFQMLLKDNPRVGKELRIIANSPRVPSNGLLLSPDLPEETRNRIRQALLDMEDRPEGKRVLGILKYRRFIPTTVDDYAPVRDAARSAGIDMRTYDYLNK